MTKPSFIHDVVNAIAEVKQKKPQEVANQIIMNFENFFNIKL